MKLQTMLLPTGEFVFVGSEVSHRPSEEWKTAFAQFVHAAGAVAYLLTDEDVEVDNALVDERALAVRMDSYAEVDELLDDEPESHEPIEGTTNIYHFPNMRLEGQALAGNSVTFETKGLDPALLDLMYGDLSSKPEPALTEDQHAKLEPLWLGGAEVGPMGTIKGGPRGPENDVINTDAFVGRRPGGPQTHEVAGAIDLDVAEPEPEIPAVGQLVRVLEVNRQGPDNPYVGLVGRMVSTTVTWDGNLGVVLQNDAWRDLQVPGTTVPNKKGTVWATRWEVVEDEPLKLGDRVRIVKLWRPAPHNEEYIGRVGVVDVIRRNKETGAGQDDPNPEGIARVRLNIDGHVVFATEWERVDEADEGAGYAEQTGWNTTDPEKLDAKIIDEN